MNRTRLSNPLLERHVEYRLLCRQHRNLELRLRQLAANYYTGTVEEVEARRLKKRKLALKDRMASIARQLAPAKDGHS